MYCRQKADGRHGHRLTKDLDVSRMHAPACERRSRSAHGTAVVKLQRPAKANEIHVVSKAVGAWTNPPAGLGGFDVTSTGPGFLGRDICCPEAIERDTSADLACLGLGLVSAGLACLPACLECFQALTSAGLGSLGATFTLDMALHST